MKFKPALALLPLAALCVSGFALAQARDWRDMRAAHDHIIESIHELERARAANHYDMDGHGARAEDLLRQAEHELQLSEEWARRH